MITAGQHSRLPRDSESDPGGHPFGGEQSGVSGPFQASRDEVRLALHKVLNSPEFSSVVQLRAFLNYVVSKAIDDRLDDIKGYTIAVEALGRDASFNPVTDPIVRVEAARLRRRLVKYYTGSGRNDPIEIEIPKGSYVPVFSLKKSGAGAARPASGPAADRTGRPCADTGPSPVDRVNERHPRDPADPLADDRQAAAVAGAASIADRNRGQPAASAGSAVSTGTDQHTIRLPVAIAIMVIAFVTGYALGTVL